MRDAAGLRCLAKISACGHTLFRSTDSMEKSMVIAQRGMFFVLLALTFSTIARAQTTPSEAQIRKDVMNPGVIEVIFRGSGSFDKFVSNGAVVNEYYRSITVRRKGD